VTLQCINLAPLQIEGSARLGSKLDHDGGNMIEDVRSGSRLHGNAMLYIHRYQGTG